MHTVYLLRHAKSDWLDQTLPDHARPLAPRGRRDAKRIAKHLRRRGIEPMLVLCSSAERTRETLELVRPALGGAPVQIEDGLYAAANDELLERLRVLPEQSASVLVIGHNPRPAGARARPRDAGSNPPALGGQVPDGRARHPRRLARHMGAAGCGRRRADCVCGSQAAALKPPAASSSGRVDVPPC